MNNSSNYTFIHLTINGQSVLQTLGLYDSLELELRMQLVISESLTRGIMAQVACHLVNLLKQPSLFNDVLVQYTFKENNKLCLIPFVLLENEGICHIIIPDPNGYYPWQKNCKAPFNHQADEALLVSNMLTLIKSFFLTHLMLNVAIDVYAQIGHPINFPLNTCLSDIPDYLADLNLDLYIAMTLCFNKTMSKLNDFVISACKSIPLNLTDMDNPTNQAAEIAIAIYQPTLQKQYVNMIMNVFYKLTQS